ncbi:MAG: hypothetical protein E7046_12935 [Lentisphaerae bacterium]|nr:hypothetical protein [Lentisphaerota bacterium]
MSVNTISGDTVSFSGDPMSFSGGAAVRIAGGLLHFGNGIDVSGDIAFVHTAPQHWIATDERKGGLYGDEFTVVLENADLNDIEISAAYLNGKANGGDSNGNAQPYHVMRGEAWMEVQLQQCLGITKVVKIRLEQDGSDIKAKILYARFVRSQNAIGEDFDNPSGNFTIENIGFRTTEGTPEDYYGCSKLFFTSRERIADVMVSGPFTCSGTVDIASEMKLSLVNQENAKVAKLSLPDGAIFAVSTDGSSPVDKTSVCEHGYVPKSAWSVFAHNRNLKDVDIDSISGTLGGRSLSWTPVEAWVGYFRWVDDTTLSFQFQYKADNSTLTKGVWAKLRQYGDNIEIIAIDGCYYTGGVGTKSFESEGVTRTGSYASSGESQSGYCILSFNAAFTRPGYASCVTLVDGGTSQGGKIVIAGSSEDRHAELRVTNRAGLPTNGVVSVGRYGVLSLINADTFQGVSVADGTCDIHVEAGGKFRQGGDKSFSENLSRNRQSVIIDGGEAEFGCECSKSSSSVDSVDTSGSTYLNFLTLRNGARCYGKAVRLGNCDARWIVEGTSPSFWDADISLLARGTLVPATVTFDVLDVTSSEAVDFTVSGSMKMFTQEDYRMLHVTKTGSGTMKVNGVTDFTAFPLVVSNGIWMVGADNTMNAAQNIRLDGGAFAADTGVHAAVGTLAIGISDCGIIAGEGATIVFLDSSAVAWGGGRVDVECSPGSVVRFGDSSSALTASQQRKLYLNGARAKLDANGFVVLKSGFAMSIR